MDLQKTIDYIISQEKKEISNYVLFSFVVILCFFILLSYNLISGYITDKAAALTNFLTLAVEYIPFQQIVKRRKKINYFDKIVRIGIQENEPEKEEFKKMINSAIEDGLKS
jgi:hypothetical protein